MARMEEARPRPAGIFNNMYYTEGKVLGHYAKGFGDQSLRLYPLMIVFVAIDSR